MTNEQFVLIMRVLLDILWQVTRSNDGNLFDWQQTFEEFMKWKKENL